MQKNEEWGKISGFLDKDTDFSGEISFVNSIRIDGKFKGKILKGSSLIVGENGIVDADVDVENISVNGILKGKLRASEKFEIYSKGKVSGEIVTPKLVIEEGAFFEGSCLMESRTSEKKNTPKEVQIKEKNSSNIK